MHPVILWEQQVKELKEWFHCIDTSSCVVLWTKDVLLFLQQDWKSSSEEGELSEGELERKRRQLLAELEDSNWVREGGLHVGRSVNLSQQKCPWKREGKRGKTINAMWLI